jgi:hypothetical protein
MAALQGEFFPLDIHPRHRLRVFINGPDQFFGNRRDFRSTPQLTLVATGALLRVNLYNLQFFLLVEKVSLSI